MITQNMKVIMRVQLLLFNKEFSLQGKESQNGFIKHFGWTTFPPHTDVQQLFESSWQHELPTTLCLLCIQTKSQDNFDFEEEQWKKTTVERYEINNK